MIAIDQDIVQTHGCDYEDIVRIANAALSLQLIGEDPRNDMSKRHKAFAKALDYIRDDIRQAVTKFEMGHFGTAATLEIVNASNAAIKAMIDVQ